MFKYIAWCLFFISHLAIAQQGYYRSPALQGDNVVFTAEGDLWLYSLSSKFTKRLTTHPAEEKQAAISLDGKWIAFSANYEGSTEVYVIPIAGGVAKRVTFENSGIKVQSWLKNGTILYATNSRVGPTGNWTLKTVNPNNFITKTLPLADAVQGSIDEQNQLLFFTQFGLLLSGDNAKVYRGGAEGELWRFSLNKNKEATLLTAKHQGDARQPMYFNNKLYFISDASGADNIWVMKTNGKKAKQITKFKQWPVRSAQLNNNRIIFQQGADIKLLDLSNNSTSTLDISLTSDLANLREHWLNKPLKFLNSANLSNEKVAITARGRIAIASKGKNRLVEVDTPKSSRNRSAILSKDGKSVYAINDSSGELEIWQFSADGSEKAKQLTYDGNIFRWDIVLSPDGKTIAHDDKSGNLWLLNIATGTNKKILTSNAGLDPFQDIIWSANSEYLAITRSHQQDQRSRILLYAVKDNKQKLLTTDKYHSFSPAFGGDGNWLYFLSDRYFKATPSHPWGDRNMGTKFDRRSQVFAYPLNKTAKFGFQVPNELLMAKEDITEAKAEPENKDKTKTTKQESKDKTPSINWQYVGNNLWQVPISAGNYSQLNASKKHLYLLSKSDEPKSKTILNAIEIKADTSLKKVTDNVSNYQLSHDKKTILVIKKNTKNMFIFAAKGSFPKEIKDIKVNTTDWQLVINPQEEWQQIFHDAWLMHRDFLYDANMRGVDWEKVKAKYQPLLKRLTDRHELNDIFKQMMGELNTLHSQVRGGDISKDKNAAKAATLGAMLTQTKQGVVIEHIYQTEKALPSSASPLNQAGTNVQSGDLILSINGKKITDIAQINAALRNQVGKQVLLIVSRNKTEHKNIVLPISTRQDFKLRYQDWVFANQNKVTKKNKNIGYLHLYAMGGNDVASFARDFYANIKKDGLIIDVRRNRGGNIDSWIIEKLLRRAWMFWQTPIGEPATNMQDTFRGHLVVLADQMTYSDGETFTAAIIANKLAPVIGKQTAGAGVWLRGLNRQVDGGMARVAEFPVYAMDGRWIVEGHGVKPTIEVDNLPHATFNGEDAQLTAAIKYLNKKMRKNPIKPMKAKAFTAVDKPADDILK